MERKEKVCKKYMPTTPAPEFNAYRYLRHPSLEFRFIRFCSVNFFDDCLSLDGERSLSGFKLVDLESWLYVTPPAGRLGNDFGSAFSNSQDCQHRVDGGHSREDASVCDTEAFEAADLELRIDDGHLVVVGTHLGGSCRMIDGVRNAAAVFTEVLIALNLWSRGYFFLDPVAKWCLLGDFPCSLETCHYGGCVITFWVGEVAEVEGGLNMGI